MFKRFLLFFLFCSLLFGCTVTEQPKFIGLENIKVINSNIEAITLSADAIFINPNDVGGTLKTEGLLVYINDTEVAQIISDEFDVPSQKKFNIPLTATILTNSIINKNSIGGLLSSLLSENIKVQYKGDIKYNVFGYSSIYKIDETQNVKIKL